MLEISIRWHGRGGQGTVTAAQIIATTAIDKGLYAQAFPEFGPERRGAPVRAYTRVSTKPIRHREPILRPDYLVILDSTLLRIPGTLDGVNEKTWVIINTSEKPELDINCRLVLVNATEIAIKTIGKPIVNTAIIGALLKVFDLIKIEDVVKSLSKFFKNKLYEVNRAAIEEAYKLAEIVK